MDWTPGPAGKTIRATTAPGGRLLLHTDDNGQELIISTNYKGEDGEFHLVLSSDQDSNGLVYKNAIENYAWDISDIAKLEIDFSNPAPAGSRIRQGTIATDKEGELYIAANLNNRPPRIGWLSLKTLEIVEPSQQDLTCFPNWRVVTGERESQQELFCWPPDSSQA